MSLLQPFKVQPKAVVVPLQYFQPIPAAIAKHEQRLAKRVQLEASLHDCHKAIDALAHIRVSTGQIDPLALGTQHDWLRICISCARCSAGYVLSTVSRTTPTDMDSWLSAFTSATVERAVLSTNRTS